MLASIGKYSCVGFQFLEKGLAHPTFLGRLVSWGAFYGVLAITVIKVAQYAIPKIKNYLEERKNKVESGQIEGQTKQGCEHCVLKPIEENEHKPLQPAPEVGKEQLITPNPPELDMLDHKEGIPTPIEPGSVVKKKTTGWFKG